MILAVFDIPSKRSIVRSKLNAISEDHPVPSKLTALTTKKQHIYKHKSWAEYRQEMLIEMKVLSMLLKIYNLTLRWAHLHLGPVLIFNICYYLVASLMQSVCNTHWLCNTHCVWVPITYSISLCYSYELWSSLKGDGHLRSISAHGKLFIKLHVFNLHCQLDIIKLDLYKSKIK